MPELVVDVQGLEFIDAAGMWALLDSAHAHPEGLRLTGTSEASAGCGQCAATTPCPRYS